MPSNVMGKEAAAVSMVHMATNLTVTPMTNAVAVLVWHHVQRSSDWQVHIALLACAFSPRLQISCQHI